ncbi:MAG: glycosyltransferase, partial [Thermomicrobiales bacterium]
MAQPVTTATAQPAARPAASAVPTFLFEAQDAAPVATSAPADPVIAAIPAHNEARFIGSVVLSVRRYVDLVLVIDDGSTDATADLAEAAGALVVRHPRNQGKGEAVNTAFREARQRGARALVLIDGDGQHLADDIQPVLAPVLADEADVSVGSRFLAVKSAIPAYRKAGQHALTLATNLSSGVRLTDSQSGFRAFSRGAINRLSFRGAGFSVESEMQFLIHEYNLRVAEVPINVVYAEPAKRNPVSHGMTVLNGIIRLVSQGRPLLFFGAPGLVVFALGLLLGAYVVQIYDHTQQLAVGYAMITVLLTVIGVLSTFVGLM